MLLWKTNTGSRLVRFPSRQSSLHILLLDLSTILDNFFMNTSFPLQYTLSFVFSMPYFIIGDRTSIGFCNLFVVIINVIPYADFEGCLSCGLLYAKPSFDIIADITNTF